MSRAFLTAIDLSKNELQNAAIQNLGTAPSSPVKGQVYFNSTDNTLYWWDGTVWQSAKGGQVPDGDKGVITVTGGVWSLDFNTVATNHIIDGTITNTDLNTTSVRLDTVGAPTNPVSLNAQKITNLADPTSALDGANKQYVDNLITGLAWSDTVRIATTANITLSGLTAIDGVTPVAGDRVLVKNQTNPAENGIYVAASGAWTRATDADTESELLNMAVWVSVGTVNADTAWVMTSDAPITVNTTPMTWVQFAGTGTVNAGAGLTRTGNTLDVGAGTGITVAADTIALDTTYTDGRYALAANGAKRFAGVVANALSTVLTHNFNTQDVLVSVYRVASPFDEVECDVEHTSVNTVTVRFAVAPAAGAYRVVIEA